ncbi:MAG: hypothetical protein MZU79_03905 [Anaerotruncus sp.]|nr:hypothetical protein [Anaerotruncus sp.]
MRRQELNDVLEKISAQYSQYPQWQSERDLRRKCGRSSHASEEDRARILYTTVKRRDKAERDRRESGYLAPLTGGGSVATTAA